MWFTALLPILSSLIDKLFPDPEKAAAAKLELQVELDKAAADMATSQKEVITTEISSGSWASNWRAYLMMICISVVGYNWIIVSLLNAFLVPLGVPIVAVPVPPELWTVVGIGLGGYLGKETISNYSENKYNGTVDDKKFFDVLHAKLFKSGMTQEQVSILSEALKARDGD